MKSAMNSLIPTMNYIRQILAVLLAALLAALPAAGQVPDRLKYNIPNPAPGNPASYGALALIVGTFIATFIALVIAVPVGLGAAVYISEFAKGKVKETLKVVIELLAAIPSIVWGFIGLMVLGPIVQMIFCSPQLTG